VGSNLTEGGGFFSKEGTSAGPWMCVYVSSGLTVGWWKEERHSSMDVVCCIRVVLPRKEKGEERVGVGGQGKYPGAPPHIKKKKREEKTSRPQGT
jgi:hypothetical protein